MYIIGLSGGIAAGKTTISHTIAALGVAVINADHLGHEAYKPSSNAYNAIIAKWPHVIPAENAEIDRKVLGSIVFVSKEHLQELNAIVWPVIRELINSEIARLKSNGDKICLIEAAVLFEAGWEDLCSEVWVIETTEDRAIERLTSRNGLTREQAVSRIRSQLSNNERRQCSNRVFINNGNIERVKQEVSQAIKDLM